MANRHIDFVDFVEVVLVDMEHNLAVGKVLHLDMLAVDMPVPAVEDTKAVAVAS